MRRSEVFIFVVILLIVASIIYRAAHFTEELSPLITWPLGGLFAGTITSAFWFWRKKNLSAKNVMGFSVMITMIFLGLGFIDIAVTSNNRIEEAQKWPEISAVITLIDIYEKYPGKIRSSTGRWAPIWSYTYEIQNKKIISHSMSAPYVYILDFQHTREKAISAGSKRPVGATVTAHYNPQNIDESTLDLVKGGDSGIMYFLGIVIILMASAGLFAMTRVIRQK